MLQKASVPFFCVMPKAFIYFSAVVSLFYIGIGILIAFSNKGSMLVQYPYNVFLGLLITGYGLFRTYRFYRVLFLNKNE